MKDYTVKVDSWKINLTEQNYVSQDTGILRAVRKFLASDHIFYCNTDELGPELLSDIKVCVEDANQNYCIVPRVNDALASKLRLYLLHHNSNFDVLKFIVCHAAARFYTVGLDVLKVLTKIRFLGSEWISKRLTIRQKSYIDAIVSRFFKAETMHSSEVDQLVLVDGFNNLQDFSFPKAIHVALTKNCNLKCIMCPYHSESLKLEHSTPYFNKGSRLPAKVLDKIISEAAAHKAHLSFGQYDEPFIYKGFASWAVKAKVAGCGVSITTNGTLLKKEEAEALLEAGVDQISFSLDAASHKTYSEIRLDDFSIPLENLKMISKLKREMGSSTQLRACLVVQPGNEHEVESFYDLIDDIGLDMVSFYNLSTFENGIWVNNVLNFDVNVDVPTHRAVCSQLYDQIAIYPDGKVALCCLTTMYVGYRDDVPYVGSVTSDSIERIWRSEKYNSIRREAFNGKFSNSVCRDCTIWHNYQGKKSVNDKGHTVYQNAYETVVYLK